jgi:hypothetical protein
MATESHRFLLEYDLQVRGAAKAQSDLRSVDNALQQISRRATTAPVTVGAVGAPPRPTPLTRSTTLAGDLREIAARSRAQAAYNQVLSLGQRVTERQAKAAAYNATAQAQASQTQTLAARQHAQAMHNQASATLAAAQAQMTAGRQVLQQLETRRAVTGSLLGQNGGQRGSLVAQGAGWTALQQMAVLRYQAAGSGGGAGVLGGYGGGGGFGSGGGGITGAAGNFGRDFGRGFRGLRDRPYAEQLGQTFKFATFYGAAYQGLNLVTEAFASAYDEATKFQVALAQLSFVTGKSDEANRDLALSLGAVATAAGQLPSTGVEAGTRALGLYNRLEAPLEEQQAVAGVSTRVATQLAFVTGQTVEQIQQNLGAISQAFELDYAGQLRAQNNDAYFFRKFGIAPGSTLETTAQVGTLGRSAGFSLEEVQAIAADLQARTGQAPGTVAGFLSQIFGKSNDARLQSVFAQLGIDGETFRDQFVSLSKELKAGTVTVEQLSAVAETISKGKASGAFKALIQDLPKIVDVAGAAQREAGGAGEKVFQAQMDTVRGAVAEFGTTFVNLAKNLLASGFLDALALFVKGGTQLLKSLNSVVEVFNKLDKSLRYLIITATAAAVANRVLGGTWLGPQGFNRASAYLSAGSRSNLGVVTRGNQTFDNSGNRIVTMPLTPAQRAAQPPQPWTRVQPTGMYRHLADRGLAVSQNIATGQMQATAIRNPNTFIPMSFTQLKQEGIKYGPAVPTGATGAAAVGRGAMLGAAGRAAGAELLGLATNPVTIVLGVITAFGLLRSAILDNAAALRQARQGATDLNAAGTVDEYRTAATALSDARAQYLKSTGGFGRAVTPTAVKDQTAEEIGSRENAANIIVKRLEDEAKAEALTSGRGAFGPRETRTVESMNATLERMAAKGFTAKQQLEALNAALDGTAESASGLAIVESQGPVKNLRQVLEAQVPTRYLPQRPEPIGQQNVESFNDALTGSGSLAAKGRKARKGPESIPFFAEYQDEILQALLDNLPTTIDASQRGLLTDTQKESTLTAFYTALEGTGADPKKWSSDLQAILARAVEEFLNSRFTEAKGSAATPLETYVDVIKPRMAQMLDDLFPGDTQGRLSVLKNEYDAMTRLISQAGGLESGPQQIIADRDKIEAEIINLQVEEIDKTRTAAQSRTTSKAESTRIGMNALAEMVKLVAASPDPNALPALLNGISRAEMAVVRSTINAAVKTARAALNAQKVMVAAIAAAAKAQEVLKYVTSLMGATVKLGGRQLDAYLTQQQTKQGDLQAALDAELANLSKLGNITLGGDEGKFSGADVSPAFKDTAGSTGPTKAQIAAAKAEAEAQRVGGDIAASRAALASAAADLKAAKKGTIEYYQALGAYYQAQEGLRQALRDYSTTTRLLAGDITNPVFEAAVELQAAQRKLKEDQGRGAAIDVIAADRLDVKRAQANLESTKFQQWISDLQTNEQLGRISHTRYLQMLEQRRDQLKAVAVRTRQQQEELNQVELAIKSAKEAFAGQFNIGDIKLPTPYEVRRYITAQTQGLGYQAGAGAPQTNVTVNIDGADTGQILEVISKYLGPGSNARLATATRRQ